MEIIYLQMPAEDWDRIVAGITDICAAPQEEVDVLKRVKVQWRGTPEE